MTTADPSRPSRHWTQIGERGVFAGIWLMFRTYRLFGRGGFALLLYPVVFYFFLFGKTARRASRDFLRRVHDHSTLRPFGDSPPGLRQSFRQFIAFGDAVLDKLAAWTGRIRSRDVDYENLPAFKQLVDAGRGGLLIVSHLGNPEVSRAIGSLAHDIRIRVLVHTRHSANFNRLMRETSPDSVVSLMQTAEIGPDTAIRLRECIDRGEFIVIAGDRTPVMQSPRVSWAPFLGRPAPFPQGPYILANLLECPVLLLFCLKCDGRYRVVFEPFADRVSVPRRDRQAALDAWVARFADRLAHHAERYPYQWFNFFDFWSQAATMPKSDSAPPDIRSSKNTKTQEHRESACKK